jgi:hypothetical protein
VPGSEIENKEIGMNPMRILWNMMLYVLISSLICTVNTWAEKSLPVGKGKVGFWFGVNQNGIFDEQTLQFIANNAGMVILNAPLRGPISAYDYPVLVQLLHELHPELPVLFSTWASRWHEGGRISSKTFTGYPNLGSFLIHDFQGNIVQRKNGNLLFGDVGQK